MRRINEQGEDEEATKRQAAARQRAAQEQVERAEHALDELQQIEAARKPKQQAARAAGIRPGFEAKFFIWDEATDTFQCPAGKTLKYRRTSRKHKREYRQYQGKRSDCRSCGLRERCCPKSGWRTVSRAEEDEVMARHRKRIASERAKAAYAKRSQTAEFPNAWLKERFGLRKFRLKGLRKARTELLWAVLAYNVRAWIRLVWATERELAATAA